MSTWYGDAPPPPQRPKGMREWVRILVRGLPIALVVFGGLALSLLIRIIERPLWDPKRPITARITTVVSRAVLWLMGFRYRVDGRPMSGIGAQVANHASWLDIFVLNACQQIYFVSKAEVANWPGIGWHARATGTVFITRDRRDARQQAEQFHARTRSGHRLLFFPEGTSSDSQRVLPFKPTLFEAFFSDDLRADCAVQPVTVMYRAPEGQDPRAYGWWGDMDFARHLLEVLAQPRQGSAEVVFHDPISVASCESRKDLAQRCEATIRARHQLVSEKSAATS